VPPTDHPEPGLTDLSVDAESRLACGILATALCTRRLGGPGALWAPAGRAIAAVLKDGNDVSAPPVGEHSALGCAPA
jgi:hypothetical protein